VQLPAGAILQNRIGSPFAFPVELTQATYPLPFESVTIGPTEAEWGASTVGAFAAASLGTGIATSPMRTAAADPAKPSLSAPENAALRASRMLNPSFTYDLDYLTVEIDR
jgi:hypothetical protein